MPAVPPLLAGGFLYSFYLPCKHRLASQWRPARSTFDSAAKLQPAGNTGDRRWALCPSPLLLWSTRLPRCQLPGGRAPQRLLCPEDLGQARRALCFCMGFRARWHHIYTSGSSNAVRDFQRNEWRMKAALPLQLTANNRSSISPRVGQV